MTDERERLPDFWAAFGADEDDKRDQCIEYALSTDDANGGELAREMVNAWINDRLQDDVPQTYHLIGLNHASKLYIGVDPAYQTTLLARIDADAAEIAALKKDAARYRWAQKHLDIGSWIVQQSENSPLGPHVQFKSWYDTDIDAALSADRDNPIAQDDGKGEGK